MSGVFRATTKTQDSYCGTLPLPPTYHTHTHTHTHTQHSSSRSGYYPAGIWGEPTCIWFPWGANSQCYHRNLPLSGAHHRMPVCGKGKPHYVPAPSVCAHSASTSTASDRRDYDAIVMTSRVTINIHRPSLYPALGCRGFPYHSDNLCAAEHSGQP